MKKSKGLAKIPPLPDDAPLVGRKYILEGHGYAGNIVTIKGVWFDKKEKEWKVQSYREDYESDHTETLKEFLKDDPILIEKEHEADLEEWAAGEMGRIEKESQEEQEQTEANASTALARPNSKQTLIDMRARTEVMRQRAELVQRIMERRLERLRSRAHELRKQFAIIQKHIDVIELYLGVYETITQLKDGVPAPIESPITFRQQILYMDEEYGDPRPRDDDHRGIDWQNVEDFDQWLVQEKNVDRLLPEIKGAVAIRPSRQHRTYTDNDWINAEINAKNKMTYILIRNGDRIWRIWTGTELGSKLFPGKGEFDRALKKSRGYFDEERAKEKEFSYKRNLMLLQGLIDRTDVFGPLPGEISLMNTEAFQKKQIVLIYDDEPALADGRLTWQKWKEQINGRIGRGSRVIIAETIRDYDYMDADSAKGRLKIYMNQSPGRPKPGIYTVYEETKCDGIFRQENKLWIRYNPGDTIWSYGWRRVEEHERMRRLSFAVFRSDPWLLNYDQIDLSDVEYYLNNRLDRVNYLNMIPVLWELRDQRIKEMEWEKHFVALVAARTQTDEKDVWRAVDWWKHKNIWKRPISQNDSKALRMVEKRVKGKARVKHQLKPATDRPVFHFQKEEK